MVAAEEYEGVAELDGRRGLGYVLRAEMDRRDLTQEQAAAELGVSIQSVRKWLRQRPGDGGLGPRKEHRPALLTFLRLKEPRELDDVIKGRAPNLILARQAASDQTQLQLTKEPLTAEQVDALLDKVLTPGLSDAQVALAERMLEARGFPVAGT